LIQWFRFVSFGLTQKIIIMAQRPLVISKAEFTRMKKLAINGESLSETPKRGASFNTADRQKGNRQKRVAARAEKAANKEAAMVELDLEEEKFQAQQRKLLIQNAHNLMYAQDARVQGLRGADLLTEVLRERDAHKDFKKERQSQMQEWERGLDDKRLADAEEEIQREGEKMQKLHLEATKVAGSQLEQALKNRALRKAQRQMELAEQASLNEDSHNFAVAEQKIHESKQQRNRDFVVGMQEQIVVKKGYVDANAELLELERVKNEQYNTTKDVVVAEWDKQKVEARNTRAKAIDSLAVTMTGPTPEQIQLEIDIKNAKITEEKFRLEDERNARKAYGRVQQQTMINKYRELTVEQKAAKRKAEKDMLINERLQIEEESHNLAAQERAKVDRQHTVAVALKDTHAADVVKKQAIQAAEKEALVEFRLEQARQQEEEVERLQKFAAARRDAAVARGCTNVHALDKAVSGLHPKEPKDYTKTLPTTFVRRVGNPYPGNSKARMGFIF